MWEPYVQSTRAHLHEADAKIVFDKFHVVKHLHDAVDHVRSGEHRTLKRDGDARLTGSKYLWLRRPADLPPEHRLVLRALQREDFKVGRAWALKKRFRTFWEYRYPGAAQTFFHPLLLARDPQPAPTDGGRPQADPAASAEPELPLPSAVALPGSWASLHAECSAEEEVGFAMRQDLALAERLARGVRAATALSGCRRDWTKRTGGRSEFRCHVHR